MVIHQESPAIDAVTVVVATRNRCDRLRHCLNELTSLPDRPAVIVVDNGSTDNTAALVRLRFPSVRLVRLASNRGALARNIGVKLAQTPVVAFADDDSWWLPGALTRATELMHVHPRLALVAARILVGRQGRLDDMARFMASAPLGFEPDLPGPSVLGFVACATIVRREAFLQAGGFDPVVFFMGEEARVAYDLARLGWGLAYCDDVVAVHDPGRGADPARSILADRNRALTSWMRRPVRLALRDSLDLIAKATRGRDARRAAVELLRRLPAALGRRTTPDAKIESRLRLVERPWERRRFRPSHLATAPNGRGAARPASADEE